MLSWLLRVRRATECWILHPWTSVLLHHEQTCRGAREVAVCSTMTVSGQRSEGGSQCVSSLIYSHKTKRWRLMSQLTRGGSWIIVTPFSTPASGSAFTHVRAAVYPASCTFNPFTAVTMRVCVFSERLPDTNKHLSIFSRISTRKRSRKVDMPKMVFDTMKRRRRRLLSK